MALNPTICEIAGTPRIGEVVHYAKLTPRIVEVVPYLLIERNCSAVPKTICGHNRYM